MQSKRFPPAFIALAAALLFGASTPSSKLLIGQVNPQLLAGLLYLSSGIGLFATSFFSKAILGSRLGWKLKRSDLAWLVGAIFFGGVVAPFLLMVDLSTTTGGAASLLLNLEAVLTSLLAWFVFKENFDRRIFFGMISIVGGSCLLSWQPAATVAMSLGSMAILGSCFCWALDNNLTRNISEADPVQIAATKGLVAGIANCSIALALGNRLPGTGALALAAVIGFLGYGVSLVLFIKALRYLGTARTGAYFSTAPFAGAIISLFFLHEPLTVNLLIAGGFMAFGVWLHLTETHDHEHAHAEEEHEHLHSHSDGHHQHEHSKDIILMEPHSHMHRHVAIKHSHPHFPDNEHRHEH